MLLQLIMNQPQVLGTIVKNTPTFVWGLLAGLTALGLSQARDRSASLARIMAMPVVMTAFSLWGTVSSFSASPMFGYVMLAWMVAASITLGLVATMGAPRGASYEAATRTFSLRGSLIPLALILGIFLTKYVVGVETAMQPSLAQDGQYTLVAGTLYGLFSGIFMGRAARLLMLAYRSTPLASPAYNA